MSTLLEINQQAQRILRDAFGPVNYIRYQQQFSNGAGDYTSERQQQTPDDTGIIAQRVAEMKAAGLLVAPKAAVVLNAEL